MPRKAKPISIKSSDPSIPLDPKREAFVAAICRGAKLKEAHSAAGFAGKSHAAAFQLRHAPEVDARVKWMLRERVKVETRAYTRRQKKSGDLLAQVVDELRDVAFQDVREVADWRREAVTNADGEVIGVNETVAFRDSKSLTPAAARAVKGIMLKGGKLTLEMHDKLKALETLARILKGDDVAITNNVTVQQVNVGATDAIDAARRIAFLISAANASAAVRTIEGQAVQVSTVPDAEPSR